MITIHGKFDSKFARVRDALAANLDSGADIGASAAVYIDGEPVVDIWGGHLDVARTQAWQRDTIVNTFSTTKTMTALCMLSLADRGVDIVVAAYDSLAGRDLGPRPKWTGELTGVGRTSTIRPAANTR
jgi:CubicO group peptidase (beta-lactamase class C family)